MVAEFRARAAGIRARVGERWIALPADVRAQLSALSIVVLAYTAHYLVYCVPQPFFIEDAGISFAYARHLIEGEGLVPYPGGERVEGYSNALWTFLVAIAYAFTIPPWVSAKLFGWGFGVVAMGFAWALARRARPTEAGWWPLVAPLMLAVSPQFVIWNASGLENSLFCALLAMGSYLLVREVQDGEVSPWSGFCFFGLTMTRPDGLAYALVALTARAMGSVARGQWLGLVVWLLAAGLPFGVYNALRYDYFAWPWPNTYYAKEKQFQPFQYNSGAWKQIREYFTTYWIVWTAPVLVLGLAGRRGWRLAAGAALLALLAFAVLWDGRTGVPTGSSAARWLTANWSKVRVWTMLGVGAGLGGVTLGRPGWEARGLLWAALCSGVFFVLVGGADWMKGFRWFSMTSVPLFVLLAVGLGELASLLPWRFRGVSVGTGVALAVSVVLSIPAIRGTVKFANDPETQVRDVLKRVNYMSWVQKRLGIDHVTLMDVDMGAHMWFSGWDIAPDLAGLIDVPVSHHNWEKAFADEYVFVEKRPDFAHVHGSWANTTRLNTNPNFKEEYVEIPGFPSGRRALHVGNHVRKDHLVGKRYAGPEGRAVPFEGTITLEGWDVPSPKIAPGGKLYVDTTWRAGFREAGFRVIAFIADAKGHVHAAEVAPGYDWYRPEDWQPHDYVYGRWSVAIPESMPEGTYDFGLVLLDEATGAVLAPTPAGGVEALPTPEGELAEPEDDVRYMRGEWRVSGAVELVSVEAALAEAEIDWVAAKERAARGDCDGAWTTFENARRHIARNDRWFLGHVVEMNDLRVGCLVRQAQTETDPKRQVAMLKQANEIDHRHEGLRGFADPLGKKLQQQGDEARARGDWQAAFDAYLAGVTVNPALSWARRGAEEMRDKRLGLGGEKPKSVAKPKTAPKALPKRAGKPKAEEAEQVEAVEEEAAVEEAAGGD